MHMEDLVGNCISDSDDDGEFFAWQVCEECNVCARETTQIFSKFSTEISGFIQTQEPFKAFEQKAHPILADALDFVTKVQKFIPFLSILRKSFTF